MLLAKKGYKVRTRRDSETQRVIHNELVINEDEADKVRTIYEMKIQNHSYSNISQITGKSINTIKNILQNKSYTGILEYKEAKIMIPIIISQEYYEQVQEQLKKEAVHKAIRTTL